MFGSEVLEVGIGMALLFAFVSLIASAALEAVESAMKTRAGDLERGIRELLNDRNGNGLAKQLYNHPIIYSLFSGKYDPSQLGTPGLLNLKVEIPKSGTASANSPDLFMSREARQVLPSYIPSSSFALALLDIAAHGAAPWPKDATSPQNIPAAVSPPSENIGAARDDTPPSANGKPEPNSSALGGITIDGLRNSATLIDDERIRRVILSAIDAGQGDLDKVRKQLENWYDGTMDRVSGWYKRRSQNFLLAFGLLVAVVLNVDAITIASHLFHDKPLRQAIIASADSYVTATQPGVGQNPPAPGSTVPPADRLKQLTDQLDGIGYPIGWYRLPQAPGCNWNAECARMLLAIPGWLMTALAIMLGAPFWFDVLNKLMVIRSTVKPKEKSPEEGSEDRQKAQP